MDDFYKREKQIVTGIEFWFKTHKVLTQNNYELIKTIVDGKEKKT